MSQPVDIAANIRNTRIARDLTQRQLAAKLHVSAHHLGRIERGERDVTPALMAAVATALGVDLNTISGQPYDREGPRRDPAHAHIPLIRTCLTYWDVPPERLAGPRDLAALRADVIEVEDLRRDARYRKLGERLPDLLEEITLACHQMSGSRRLEAFGLLSRLYFATHSLTYKLGYSDLSAVVEERLRWSAWQSQDPLMAAIASYARTNSMLCVGTYDVGLHLMDRVRAELDSSGSDEVSARPRMNAYGGTHLRSAILAARANRSSEAWSHIDAARQIAVRLRTAEPARRGGAADNLLTFGLGNTDIHAVAVAVELGDGPDAIARADDLVLPRGLPKTRYGHHFLDLSRAYLWQGDRGRAQRALERARGFAPSQTRHHPTTHEVTRMLVRQQRRANESLTRFAEWVGVDI
jgi:transcriptional regulator with XRE-family HTH domain